MKKIRFTRKILSTLLRDKTHYRGRLFVDTASLLARCGILLLLYYYVFSQKGGEINNTAYVFVAWSMLLYFIFMTFGLRNVARSIMQDVQSGTVEILLSRPMSYLWYKMWWQIGSGLYSFLVSFFLGATTLFLIIGLPHTMLTASFFLTFLLTSIGTIFLTLLVYTAVGLLSFWIEEVSPIYWIVDKAVMILGGSYLPIALFPPIMYKIALYSPFGVSQFITHTVYESWHYDWPLLISIQLVWIIMMAVVVYLMFSRARAKVSINGG